MISLTNDHCGEQILKVSGKGPVAIGYTQDLGRILTHSAAALSLRQAASAGGHEKVVHMLLDAKADVNAQGGRHDNALQAASARAIQDNHP